MAINKLISIEDDVKNSVPIALYRLRSGCLLNTAAEVEVDKADSTAVGDKDGKYNIPHSDKTDLAFCNDPLLGSPVWELL